MVKPRKGARRLKRPQDIAAALKRAAPRPSADAPRDEKKNYAERFSRALATLIANSLRPDFRGITPDPRGKRQEQPARTAKGVKKLDVNYSTPELGLGLGVSIKTVTHPDKASNRFTKNLTRIDNELRAEAMDYHVRQPYAVLVSVLFLPMDAAMELETQKDSPSSFAAAVRSMRFRAGRVLPIGEPELFEAAFVALYEPGGPTKGAVRFFDVRNAPPRRGMPNNTLTLAQFVEQVRFVYDARNNPSFEYAD